VIAEATLDIRNAFVRKVYSILTAQLIATAVVSTISFYSPAFKAWIQTHPWMMFVSLFGALGFMFATYWKRKSYPANLVFLSGFTLLEAYAIAVVTSFYEAKIVLEAVVITGALFAVLTLFACQTKYDFTSWFGVLYGSLWFLIIFGLVAMWFPGTWMDLAYAGMAAVLFSVYIVSACPPWWRCWVRGTDEKQVVDTQLIMRHMHVEEEIAAAIALYLDIINLFLVYALPPPPPFRCGNG
jgi:FtsH-binding integral membrane protein